VHRPKQGFEIPLAAWLRHELAEMGRDLLLSPRAIGRGYVRPEAARRLWEQHHAGVRDHSPEIWALMVLELWHREFVDHVAGPVRSAR
jgi:asparagine synthase (glutamine-hydrolysing)